MTYEVKDADDHEYTYHDLCSNEGIHEIENCPLCDTIISPNLLCLLEGNHNAYLVSECPKCQKVFMQLWIYESDEYLIFPKQGARRVFDECIKNLSPNFEKTFNQSIIAESHSLDEIAGMGYRKSLEYLIKDYLVSLHPDKEQEIKQLLLGRCIDRYVTNTKIKAMAKRAAWIGNDETHYEKRWLDKDINDLKMLIDLTVYWITFEIKTEEYNRIMQE